jgi:hypothetical protein
MIASPLEIDMVRYVVAVRRESRASGVTTDRVRVVPGVQVQGGDGHRMIVEADSGVANELRRRFGSDLIVEAENLHEH